MWKPGGGTRAQQHGLASVEALHAGVVTVVQRFRSDLGLYVHLHCLATDGAYEGHSDGELRFLAAPPSTPERMTACPSVDGAAATLVEVPELSLDGSCSDATAYRLSPEPPEGAVVAISGEACDPALNDTCDDLSLTFTVTAADHVAPSPATAISFDIYLPRSEWTCADIANTVYYVDVDVDADYAEPQEARARWKIEVLPDPDAAPIAPSSAGGSPSLAIRRSTPSAGRRRAPASGSRRSTRPATARRR